MGIMNKISSIKTDLVDVALIKIGVFLSALLIAKLWHPILTVRWYWYFIILLIVIIRPFKNFLKEMKSAVTK